MRRLMICIAVLLTTITAASAQVKIGREDIQSSVMAYTAQHPELYDESNMALSETSSPSVVVDVPSVNYKNFIQIGVGVPTLIQGLMLELYMYDRISIDPAYSTLSGTLASYRYYWGTERLFNAINLEYGHKVTNVVSLGAKIYTGFITKGKYHIMTDELLYRDSHVVSSAIFNVRFDWLRREWVTMYSSIGVGVVAQFMRDDSAIYPMYDATFVGLDVGRRIYGYLEIGSGISGSIRAGLGVRF